ncbi:MAG: sodium-translocating pyrophosphatase [Bacillati bacterium ANGP1]|uniref:K(+)-insensitive pyrophosphate-energized proton pump n=1 Tax=Candidatus Segetimicrobium genomatis TaxID=2569760 RepID=A0A537J8B6_9BACT|nr:MAG: sodium-translocating pyrophosphatase [Terrabacteria group bacterium ANGP1]
MSESGITLPAFGGLESTLLWLVFAAAVCALAYGWWLIRRVLRQSPGPAAMQEVAAAIQEGAQAYLGRQFLTMSLFILVITVALYALYRPIYSNPGLAIGVALAFLFGCLASFGAGYVGMTLAVRGNVRTAFAATRSFKEALETAFQAGTVSGMFVVGLGLLGATAIFVLFRGDAFRVLIGFGFGGSLVASFMRIGGGIYTKVADVGADLVGKVEVGIPEDDPRNAATIADNVGDNVGDCAGMAADVFESFEVTLVAAIILGAGTLLDPQFHVLYGSHASAFALKLILFPLLVQGIGVFASILGTRFVRAKGEEIGDPMRPINTGLWISSGAAVVGFVAVNAVYLTNPTTGAPDWRFSLATFTGLLLALVIKWLTDQFTNPNLRPVTEMAYSTKTGPATFLLSGLGFGLESSVWAVLAIAATILASFTIFQGDLALAGYGVALAGLGLLSVTGYILAMDTFGPIVDNANGIVEMSAAALQPRSAREMATRVVAQLDQAGNTTKALTKGFAIASVESLRQALAAGGAVALDRVGIQVNLPLIFIGLLIGGAVPFLVSAFLIRAVGRSAFEVVEEVRRQFREIPGIMEGTAKPEYDRTVDIVTRAAQRELLSPAVIALAAPILVGFGLGVAPLGGFLAGAILTGQLLAVFMANTGGAWDNAKKKIEDGFLGGKGTEYHKAGVIGDTVGDPLKDTAGPALNPLIKVMNLTSLLVAPVAISPLTPGLRGAIVVVGLGLVAAAVAMNRRGSVAARMPARADDPMITTGRSR